MKTIGERIKHLRGDTTRDVYAPKIGVSKNTLASYESGNSAPNHTVMTEILDLHPEISPAWLMTGEGPMFRRDLALQLKQDDSEFDLIPLVEAELSAGGGSFVQSENVKNQYAFRKDWVRHVASGPKDMVMMRVTGDSMHPTIQANDTVMVDTGRTAIREGDIYAIRFDHTIMIKRLSFRPGGKIQIISDNREYQPYEADIQDIHIIGQVIFFSRVLIQE
jgi:phage repressor protein C with HTH and peptisase S24 domain/DNA-binding XRE family transcriptional regulator